MKVKKTILHIIDSLTLGGAEQLLVGTVNNLSDFNNIVVTLVEDGSLIEELQFYKHFCLNYKSKTSLLRTIRQLRKIIIENEVDVVHSHLFWSTIVARLATPSNVKFIFTVHSTLSVDAFKGSFASKLLEQITYKPSQTAIFVSNFVKQDYEGQVKLTGRFYVLHNFIPDKFFNAKRSGGSGLVRNLVAVGSLKEAKNYKCLIEAFKLFKDKGIAVSLDIYGEGPLRTDLQRSIDRFNLPIKLIGVVQNIASILPHYDGYVLCSLHEGFGLAPMEAMAIGLPVYLSDIPILHEISGGNAIFFDPAQPQSFVESFEYSINNTAILEANVLKAYEHANKISRKVNYMAKLRGIYNCVLKQ